MTLVTGMGMIGKLCTGIFSCLQISYAVHYQVFDALVSVHVGL